METCEYCGKKVKATETTSELGNYCIDCLILCKTNCEEAINKLKAKGIKPKSTSSKKKELDEALKNLMRPTF